MRARFFFVRHVKMQLRRIADAALQAGRVAFWWCVVLTARAGTYGYGGGYGTRVGGGGHGYGYGGGAPPAGRGYGGGGWWLLD